jgi:hypothetical protein
LNIIEPWILGDDFKGAQNRLKWTKLGTFESKN